MLSVMLRKNELTRSSVENLGALTPTGSKNIRIEFHILQHTFFQDSRFMIILKHN